MPISSTDVSNIIAGQIGMFSASSQYSQAISAQYGFSPSGSPFGGDPRSQVAPGNLPGGAGLASMAGRAPGMAMGGLGMMSMFNAAPRGLDPFTATMHAGAMGYRSAGMAGAMGMGGMTALGYGAMAGAGSFVTNQIATGAQNRGMITSAAQGMMPGQGVGGLNAIANQVESMQRQGMGSVRELTGLMQGGAMSGALDTGSLTRFTSSFQKLVNNVRQVAVALNTTMSQAQQAMQQVEGMGISNNNAAGFLGTARAFGAQVGIGPQQMMNYAAGGASFARGAGIDRSVGATGAVTQAGVYGMANRWGTPGILPDSYSKHMQGASRFLMSGQGRSVLGAMMDPNTGGLDQAMARQMTSGLLDRNEIMSLSRQNLAGNKDMFNSRRGELAASFLSQYGPHAASGALGAMTSNRSQPMSTQMALTGLTRSDLHGMKSLNQSASALQGQLVAEAKRGFQEGSQQQSLGGALGQAWQNLIKPIKDEFRQLGAGMTQSMQGALQSMTEEFVRSPPPSADPRARMDMFRKSLTGYGRDWMKGGQQLSVPSGNFGEFDYAPKGALSSILPQGFRIGRMSPGTSLSELSGYGLGTEEHNPYLTAAAYGSRATYGGRNALGWAGRGLNEVGRGIAAFGGTPQATGLMGMGGIGGPGSYMRGVGNLVSGAGWAARGAGFASRMLAPVGMAYDMVTNTGPAAMRRAGYSPITSGAITGDQRAMVQSLGDAGVFGDDPFEDIETGKIAGETPPGMTPLGGFLPGSAGGGFGTQRFMTAKAVAQASSRFSPSSKSDVLKRIGAADADAVVGDAIKEAKQAAGTKWESMEPGAQVTAIQGRLHAKKGKYAELSTGDVFSLVQGKAGAITNMPKATRDTFNPVEMRKRKAGDLQAFADLATLVSMEQTSGPHNKKGNSGGNIDINSMTDADINRILKQAHESAPGAFDSDQVEKVTFGEHGSAAAAYRAGNLSITNDKLAGAFNEDRFANMSHVDELKKFHSTGGGTGGVGNETGAKAAHKSLIQKWIAGDPNHATKLAGFQDSYAAAKDDAGRNRIYQRWTNYKHAQDGYKEAFETSGGGKYKADEHQYGVDELTKGRHLTESTQLDAQHGAKAHWNMVRGHYDDNITKLQNVNRSAARLSGGTQSATNHLNEITKQWHAADSSTDSLPGEPDPALRARRSLIKSVQQRLKAGMGDASDADIRAGVAAGGVMTLDDALTMQKTLASSDLPAHQDMAHSLGEFIKTRQKTRTKDGKKRTALQVLKSTGIKTSDLGKEDKDFLSDKSDVMSSRLEGEFNKMASDALRVALNAEPTKAEIDARSVAISSALRKGNMDEYESLVSTTGAPTAAGPGGGSGGKPGALAAQSGEFAKAMASATTAANSFAKNMPK